MSPKVKQEILARGYCFIEAFRPYDDSITIAAEFGRAITPWDGRFVQELIPKEAATPNSYSGIYGLGHFPFHTDLAHWPQPPRYLMLRCVNGYAEVPTLLLDGRALVRSASRDLLVRAVVKPRRPQNGAVPLLRLYETTDMGDRLRWDEVFLLPAGKVGQAAMDRVRECLAQIEPQPIPLTEQGDTILIDNWMILHARSTVPHGCENRKIERVYLENLN